MKKKDLKGGKEKERIGFTAGITLVILYTLLPLGLLLQVYV